MKTLLNALRLNFVPQNTDFALLLLRVWLGASLCLLHGWGKLTGFATGAAKFADPLGVGPTASMALTVFAEVGCAILLAIGCFTRFAALVLVILMSVAFLMVHGAKLSGPGSGELAFVYLAGFLTVLVAGPGRFSVDGKSGAAR